MAVEGYLGLPGAGKTYTMVHDVIGRRRANPHLRVYSNMDLRLPGDGELIRLDDWAQLLDANNGLVVLDEINLWMPSRAWSKLPGPMLWKWAQVRKSGLDILWTAQHVARVDKLVRELTWAYGMMFTWRKLGFFAMKIMSANLRLCILRGGGLFRFCGRYVWRMTLWRRLRCLRIFAGRCKRI